MPGSNPGVSIATVESVVENALESYEPEEVNYTEVVTYADLPDAGEFTNETFVVLTSTGLFGFGRKRAGMWRSNGTAWYRLGDLQGSGGVIFGTAPSGQHRIYRIWRSAEGNIAYEFENIPES